MKLDLCNTNRLFVASFLLISSVLAQSNSSHVVAIADTIGANWQWSADSRSFAFLDEGVLPSTVSLTNSLWYEFKVETQLVNKSPTWPIYPLGFGEIYPSDAGQGSFAFASPSGRYVVYASEKMEDYWRLSVADRTEMTTRDLGAIVGNPYSGLDEFNVFWSDSEDSVVVSSVTETSEPFIQYASGISSNIAQIQFSFFFSVKMGEDTFDIVRPFDISSDGSRILLLAHLVSSSASSQSLGDQYLMTVMLSPSAPDTQVVEHVYPGNDIRTAAFLSNNESKLLILNSQGLIELDQNDSSTVVLEPAFTFGTGETERGAWFSPDAAWLMFQKSGALFAYHVT